MPQSTRHFVAPAHERGAIAIMAAMMMAILAVLALTEFSIAALSVERRRAQNAVDAVALEIGDEMIVKSNLDSVWNGQSQGVQAMLTNNGQDGSQGFAPPAISQLTINRGFGSSNTPGAAADQAYRDAWIPAWVQVQAKISPVTAPQKALAQIIGMLPRGSGNGQAKSQYTVDAKARVAQVQFASFTVSRARAMLLFDLSRSMRLWYEGHENDPSYSALWILKTAALTMIGDLYQQFNYSVRTFGPYIEVNVPALIYDQDHSPPPFAQAKQHVSDAFQQVLNSGTVGNDSDSGTDMKTPIDEAVSELKANNDYLAGAPMLILVSDGEPDQVGSTPCSGTLQQCNQQAREATTEAMKSAWNTQINGAGVESFTFLINRENKNLSQESDAFMASIGGDHNNQTGNPNNYELDDQDVGSPGGSILKFLERLPIKDYCMSESMTDFKQYRIPEDMAYPVANERIQGYYTLGNPPGETPSANQDAYPATQVFSFAEFFAGLPNYPHIDPGSPQQPGGTLPNLREVLKNQPDLARFYYDPESKRVWLNPWLCFNSTYWQDGDTTQSPPRFRMRWGRPVLSPSDQDPLTYH